ATRCRCRPPSSCPSPSHAHPRALHSFPTRRSSDLPTTRLIPSGTPMPATHPRLGSSTSVRNDGGAVNVTTSSSASARSSTPLRRSEEHTSELQSRFDLVCRLLLEKKNNIRHTCLQR